MTILLQSSLSLNSSLRSGTLYWAQTSKKASADVDRKWQVGFKAFKEKLKFELAVGARANNSHEKAAQTTPASEAAPAQLTSASPAAPTEEPPHLKQFRADNEAHQRKQERERELVEQIRTALFPPTQLPSLEECVAARNDQSKYVDQLRTLPLYTQLLTEGYERDLRWLVREALTPVFLKQFRQEVSRMGTYLWKHAEQVVIDTLPNVLDLQAREEPTVKPTKLELAAEATLR